jgi:thermitase
MKKITTTANDGAMTDAINAKGNGTYTYRVCAAGTTTCSNEAKAVF